VIAHARREGGQPHLELVDDRRPPSLPHTAQLISKRHLLMDRRVGAGLQSVIREPGIELGLGQVSEE
jgi:hypothetical protein